jgi:hypothetical protein
LSLAIADLNGDGKPDLVTANPATDRSTDTVSVRLNRGDGGFQGRRNYRTGRSPLAVAIGDLNGDGRGETVTANFGAGTVSVLLNTGDGTFQAKVDYQAGSDPASVAIGDLNVDGKPDLAVANIDAETASVLLNRGDGTFAARRAYRTGNTPFSVAIGDVNGDDKPDLATANQDAGTVSVLLNRGDGSFPARRDYVASYGPFWVGIGDMSGDGKPDLVTASLKVARPGRHSETSILTVSVFLNRGDGSFQARRDSRGGSYPNTASYSTSSAALGDLNGDGKPDLAIACCDTPVVSVLTNRGDGLFRPRIEYQTGLDAISTSIGDFDGDDKLDLAVANYRSSTISVLINAPGLCTVQYVRGKTLQAAKRTIARANCRVGKIRRAYSKSVKRGRVISQKPRFGAVLPGGRKVDLVVSRGRKH